MSQASTRGNTTEWRKLREACFRVWGKTCMYCGDRATEVDHIIELAIGGTNSLDNVQPLCKPCHLVKTVRFNTVKSHTAPLRGVFFGGVAPTDSLGGISPSMVRIDPPTAGEAQS